MDRKARFSAIYQAMEPFRVAKKNTIRTLAGIGRKHKVLKYPIFALLVAYIFFYNLFLHMFMWLRIRERLAKGLAMAMTVIIVITSIDLPVLAMRLSELSEKPDEYYLITDIQQPEDREIEVCSGTDKSDIEFPEYIVVEAGFVKEDTADAVEETISAEEETTTAAAVEETTTAAVEEATTAAEEETTTAAEEETTTVAEEETTTAAEEETTTVAEEETTTVAAEEETTTAAEEETTTAAEEETTTVAEEETTTVAEEETTTVAAEEETTTAAEEETTTAAAVEETTTVAEEETTTVAEEETTTAATVEETTTAAEEETTSPTEELEEGVDLSIQEIVKVQFELPVEWNCDNYDKDTLGEYVFEAVIPEEYEGVTVVLDYYAVIPTITVKVIEAQDFVRSSIVDGIEVTMTAIPGVFPDNAKFSVTKISDAASIQKIEEAIQNSIDAETEADTAGVSDDENFGKVEKSISFDILVLDENGNEIQPQLPDGVNINDAIKVTFKQVVSKLETEYDEQEEYLSMDVYYIDDAMTQAEQLPTSVEGDDMTFSPEHFSTYTCTCKVYSAKYVYTWKQLYKATYNKSGTVNIKLGDDIKIERIVFYSNSRQLRVDGYTLNLDLNGYDIRGNVDNYEAIYVFEDGTLNLHDTRGGGRVTAPYSSEVIYASNGNINIYGGIISGSSNYGIYLTKGSNLTMNGGCVLGQFYYGVNASSVGVNNVTLNGGTIDGAKYGVYCSGSTYNGKIFKMTGGSIKNYTYYGVYNRNANLTITGGSFTGRSGYNTTGIYCDDAGRINIGGNISFSNNKTADIYVGRNTNNYINVTSALTGSNIGVRTYTRPTDSAPVQFTTNTTSMEMFYSARSSNDGVWQSMEGTYLVTGPLVDKTIDVEISIESIAGNDDNTNGTIGKIALGTGIASVNAISTTVKHNTPLTLKATLVDSAQYEFKGWYKGSTKLSGELIYDFNATETCTGTDVIKAVFAKKKVSITVNSSDTNRGSVAISNYSLGTVANGSTTGSFEVGSTVTLTTTAKLWEGSKYFEFYQWNDGNTEATRTITVTEAATYTAQFKRPDPDPNATGTIFIGVTQLTTVPSVGTSLLMIGGGDTMTTTADGSAQIAVAGLPDDYAFVTAVSDNSSRETTYYGSSYYSVAAKNLYGSNVLVNSSGGREVKVEQPGKDFDTCTYGKMKYYDHDTSDDKLGVWFYWCDYGAKCGIGPYNVYSYSSKKTFVASNISASFNSIEYSEDKQTVEEINIDVTITVDGSTYSIVNLVYVDEAVDYINGDKTIELDLGGVSFTYVLPEVVLESTENGETVQTPYDTLEDAIEVAESGDKIIVIGAAVSEITEEAELAENVTIYAFDGTQITTGEDSAKITASSDGTVNLVDGTLTVTPTADSSNSGVTVNVNNATVTAGKEITVSTLNGGQVTTTVDTTEVTISPDGDPNHTVTYVGCNANTTYGVSAGELTTEERVDITAGTEYDLTVQLGAKETTVETSNNNEGVTTVSKGTDANGNDTVVVESTKANDNITVNAGDGAIDYTTSEDNTKIVISEDTNDVILQEGGVNVPEDGAITLPNGEKITNTSEGSENITVSSDGSVEIPDGGEATIGEGEDAVKISVPEATPSNLPAKVEINTDGSLNVTTEAGNEVTINGETYETGAYDTIFDVNINEDGESEVIVSEGSVVLAPGQSITDSNGVTYTNPADSEGDLQLNMTEGSNTEVYVEPGESFEYTPAGSSESITYDNPGNSNSSFVVSPDGDVSLNSDIGVSGGDDVSINIGGEQVDIVVPEDNSGAVNIDPIAGSVTVDTQGDSVAIDDVVYTTTSDNTVLRPGEDGVVLESGGVELDANEQIIANDTIISNSGTGDLSVELNGDGNVVISGSEGSKFELGTPGFAGGVEFTIPDASTEYTVDPEGKLEVPSDGTISFTQGNTSTTIGAGTGGVKLEPTEDGVAVIVPDGGLVTIDGITYENSGTGELVIIIDPATGKPVLVDGTTTIPDGGTIALPGGNTISSTGGNVEVSADGNLGVSNGATVSVDGPGASGEYTAVDGTLDLELDPETGIPTLLESSTGSAQLGSDSKLDVVYNTIVDSGDGSDDATDMDIEQKITFTNTGESPVVVEEDGTVSVPAGGKVVMDSTVNGESVQNTVSVPSGSSGGSVSVEPQTDGSVDVTMPSVGDAVNVNGVEYESTNAGTQLNVAEDGASLEAGGVELDKNENINVNGTNVKNTSDSDSAITAEKNGSNVDVTATSGGEFELSVPGNEDSAVSFKNPSDTDSTYSVQPDGNIVISGDNPISFETKNGDTSVTGMNSTDVELKVTEDGVQLTAPNGGGISINDSDYSNAGTSDLLITVDKNGDVVLESGETTITEGGEIKLPEDINGESNTIVSDSGNVTVDSTGNIELTEDSTVTVKNPDGTDNQYIAAEENTKITVGSTDETPTLTTGSVELPGGSEIKADDKLYISTGNAAPTINSDGTGTLPADSGLTIENTLSNGQTVSHNIVAPGVNSGVVDVAPQEDGSIDLTVNSSGDRVSADGIEYKTTVAPTNLSVSENGVTLENGGVELDGGKKPAESINVNGTNVTNTGAQGSTVAANKNNDGTIDVVVSGGGKFELSVPGNNDSAVEFTNPSATPSTYTVQTDGSIVLEDTTEISFKTDAGDTTVSGTNGQDASLKVTEEGVEVTAPAGGGVFVENATASTNYNNAGADELKIVVNKEGAAVLKEGTANVPSGKEIEVPTADGDESNNTIATAGGSVNVDDEGNVTVPNADTEVTITNSNGTSNKYIATETNTTINASSATDVPTLDAGSVALPQNSSIIADDKTYTSRGNSAPTVNYDGTALLPADSGLKIETTVTDAEGSTEVEINVSAPSTNGGEVSVVPNSDGSVTLTVPTAGDKVAVDGIEYETTVPDTEIIVTDTGATLNAGGVKLDGGKSPAESINVNGTNITNTGDASSDVTATKNGDDIDVTVTAGGTFELAVPGVEDSAVSFKNPSDTTATYKVDEDGSIVLGAGSSIEFATQTGTSTITSTITNPVGQNEGDVSFKVTEDGVEISVEPRKTVIIDGKEYVAGASGVTIVIDENGNKVIVNGSTSVPQGETVNVKDSEGNLIPITQTTGSTSGITVSADGKIEATAGDTITVGGGTYTSNDQTGNFTLDLDVDSGEIVVEDGMNISVTNGNVTFEDNNGEKTTVSTIGDKPVVVDNSTGTPVVTVPAGGNATIGNGTDSVEVIVPSDATESKNITVEEDGDISVALNEGEKITIGGIVYEADQDGKVVVNGQTGELDTTESDFSSDMNNITTVIDPSSFNKENYTVELDEGESIVVGDVTYTAPEGGMTLSGNPNGNPIIEINEAGESIQVGDRMYTAGADGTKFIVNAPGDVTLVDSDSNIKNSTLIITAPDTITVDGNTINVNGNAGDTCTVTKTEDGNRVDVRGNSEVSVDMGTDTSIEVRGDEVTINGIEYTTPSGGTTFTTTETGKTNVEIINEGDSLKVGDTTYTAANDNTQFIVNSENNITLVDNGNNSANSAVTVNGPSTVVIDGNKFTSTGSSDSEFTVTKTEDGSALEIGDGTKVSVTANSNGSSITVNEQLSYGEQNLGDSIVISPSSGTTVVLDKTSVDANGNYVTTIAPSEGTVMKPIVDADGNIIGFESVVEPEEEEEEEEEEKVELPELTTTEGKPAKSEWVEKDGEWYFAGDDSVAVSGWYEDKESNRWYYFDEKDGTMATGWVEVEERWYYLSEDGAMIANGWHQDEEDDKWYYLSSSGAMATGWLLDTDDNWYYLDEKNGSMVTGWAEVKEEWYVLAEDGAMISNSWYQDEESERWYFLDSSGAMKTGWHEDVDGKTYYLDKETGAMATKWHKDTDGTWYYFDTSGVLDKGWLMDYDNNGAWYYLDAETGAMRIGWFEDDQDGNIYYLGKDGIMQIGWVNIKGKWYYFNSIVVDPTWFMVNGEWVYGGDDLTKTRPYGAMFINEKTPDGYIVDENGELVEE